MEGIGPDDVNISCLISRIDKENIELKLNGRFDPCIVHRIKPVIDALTYYAIYDLMGNEHE